MEVIFKFKIRIFFQTLLIVAFSLFLSPSLLAAKPPTPAGKIVFLGETSDGQKSVWLSVTGDGTFEVEAKQIIVDEWTQTNPGLHVTISPIIPNPHSLFQIIDGQMVFIDKDNQQGGITFPPLPGGLPPGEVTPPIYLPPPVVMPPIAYPPGVPAHPIANPPVVPAHPIAKPPVVPAHPIAKPPGLPTHPIAKPPGIPAHPIVPPGGGETPPGGTTPPSEGLPLTPGKTTPSQGKEVTPPGHVIPQNNLPSKVKEPSKFKESSEEKRSEEVTPTTPQKVNSPSGSLTPSMTPKKDGYSAGDLYFANLNNNTLNNKGLNNSSLNNSGSNKNGFTSEAPLTAGRRFAQEPCVNVWVDGRYFYVKDFRFGLDRKGYLTNLSIGADRRMSENLVLGVIFAYNNGKSRSFNNNWITSAAGFSAGPYFGYRLLPNWSLEGTLSIGHLENHNNILRLNGKFGSNLYSGSLIARGIYEICNVQLQPKPALYYTYFHNNSYNLNTTLNGISLAVPIATFNGAYGFGQFAVEAGYPMKFANDTITTVPYIELGVDYAFTRPNHGQILTGNLTMQGTTPWSGLARLGIRTMITRAFFVETTASYISIGQNNLDIWQARLFLSWAFY